VGTIGPRKKYALSAVLSDFLGLGNPLTPRHGSGGFTASHRGQQRAAESLQLTRLVRVSAARGYFPRTLSIDEMCVHREDNRGIFQAQPSHNRCETEDGVMSASYDSHSQCEQNVSVL
jgi:hypothetical protein